MQVLGFDAAHRGELRRRLGYMPEHDCLPPQMTARDLVVHLGELRGLPRRAAALRASEVLFQVGLDEERSRLIGTFSTGMKQRVKLAQALVHAPDLVVLDEPTNGLDPAGRDEMLLIVRRLWETLGVRVLLSSHVLSDVERTCEAVLLLREGHVVSAGLLVRARRRRLGPPARARRRRRRGLPSRARRTRARGRRDDEDALVSRAPDGASSTRCATRRPTAGVSLRELRPAERTLEDAVVSAMA